MKILQVTKYYLPAVGFGGPIQCAHNLAKQLVRMGHDVTVFTTNAYAPRSKLRLPYKNKIVEGVNVHYFPYFAMLSDLYLTPGIIRGFENQLETFDLVHLHEYRSFQNIAFLSCNKPRKPYVLQPHGMKPPEAAISEGRPLLNSSRQVYQHTFGTRLLRGASKVIALSDSERESLERIGAIGKNVVVMPNGVAPEDFANPPEPDLFRRKVGIGDEKIILYIGRVAKSKGLDTLVRSFKKLCEDKEGIRLVIAGPDDGYLEYLKELVKSSNLGEKVLFPGLISHEEKLSAYNSADVVVYPGTYEGFPIVPLEAAIMAKPVIVSDDPGMDYVSRGGFGLTFKFGHEDELKLALERLLSDEQLSRTLGSTGKACVMQNYTWEIVARRIEALYRSILSQ